jgi:hypothetical protein
VISFLKRGSHCPSRWKGFNTKIKNYGRSSLHTLAVDHQWLTHKFQRRRNRKTDVSGTVVRAILGMTAEGRADRRAGA